MRGFLVGATELKKRTLKRVQLIFLGLFLLLFNTVVYAEGEEAENDQQNIEQQVNKAASPKPVTDEVITPDTFDPTEKLSEDIPVAFPVDI